MIARPSMVLGSLPVAVSQTLIFYPGGDQQLPSGLAGR